jgi:hypothetical protein
MSGNKRRKRYELVSCKFKQRSKLKTMVLSVIYEIIFEP